MKPTLAHTEALVLDVIRGTRPFLDGLRAVVAYQRAWNPALSAWWDRRGFIDRPEHPDDVPAVPTDVFRHVRLVSTECDPVVTFRTSGTTLGARGESPRLSTAAYDLGATVQFRARVLGDDRPTGFLSLVFDPIEVPDSSLSHMVGVLAADSHAPARYFLRPDALDVDGFANAVRGARGPVVVVGTAFAFVGLIDAAPPGDLPLPPGSWVVETGGFKGRSRELARDAMYPALAALFRCPGDRIRSEYSMTELSSQLYSLAWHPPAPQRLVPPPWCQVTAVDPVSLRPLPPSSEGLLRFVDLANTDTVVAIQTSDVGSVDADGSVVLVGRAPGATPRGCSLAAEEVFEVARRRREVTP